MKDILLPLILVLNIFNVYCQKWDDYRQYYQLSNYANFLLFEGDTSNYMDIMYSLSEKYENNPFEYAKLGVIMFNYDTTKSLVILRKSIKHGYPLSSIISKFEKLNEKNFIEKELSQDYSTYLRNVDTVYVKFLENLIKSDQKYRGAQWNLPDSIKFLKQNRIDSLNLLKLTEKIKESGWPNYTRVGVANAGIAFIVVLHGTRQFEYNSEVFNFYKTLLFSEIINGNFDPISYANWIDQYHVWFLKKEQPYGSIADPEGYLYPIKSIEDCNTNRLCIGLSTLNQYLKMNQYIIR